MEFWPSPAFYSHIEAAHVKFNIMMVDNYTKCV